VQKKVLAVHDQGIQEVVDVDMRRGSWLRTTTSQEAYIGIREKAQIQDAKKIYQAAYGWTPQNTINKDDAYYVWTGLVLSNGCSRQRKITMGNSSVVEKAIKYLPDGAHVRKVEFSNGHVPDWHLNWKEFWDITGRKYAYEIEVPQWIFQSSNDKIALFLRYLYAGDGWASGHIIGYASTSRELSEGVSVLLWRLGIRSSIIKKKPQRENWREQWWVIISAADYELKFINDIGIVGKETALQKIKESAQSRVESNKRRVRPIRPCLHPENKEKYIAQSKRQKERYTTIHKICNARNSAVYGLSIESNSGVFAGTCLVSGAGLKHTH
jgi:hypothetical protein